MTEESIYYWVGVSLFYAMLIGIPGFYIIRRIVLKVARRKNHNKESRTHQDTAL